MINTMPSFDYSNCIVMVNRRKPVEKTAKYYTSENGWENSLLQEIVNNKKVVVFWGSQKKGVDFEEYLKNQYPHVSVKFYHSKGNEREMNKDLQNVRKEWKNCQVLMYTSKITVGVNFDETDLFALEAVIIVPVCTNVEKAAYRHISLISLGELSVLWRQL